jgi:hypothetical protein
LGDGGEALAAKAPTLPGEQLDKSELCFLVPSGTGSMVDLRSPAGQRIF